jgi:hypothetical protein
MNPSSITIKIELGPETAAPSPAQAGSAAPAPSSAPSPSLTPADSTSAQALPTPWDHPAYRKTSTGGQLPNPVPQPKRKPG